MMKRLGGLLLAAALAMMTCGQAKADFLTLTPPAPNEFGGTTAADGPNVAERGDFITALSSFTISSLGIEADPAVASVGFQANIYAATGLTRGALLATSTLTLPDVGQTFYDVPIAFSFVGGQDYDIAVGFSNASVPFRAFNFNAPYYSP
jgi:hypothetical protein